MLEFSKHTNPIAKKNHNCSLCNGEIHKGEKYDRFSGKYDGCFFETKLHLMCRDIIHEYCDYIEDNEYDNDNVIDWVHETVCRNCEHSWFGDGWDDCNFSSLFLCPKVVERFTVNKEYKHGT